MIRDLDKLLAMAAEACGVEVHDILGPSRKYEPSLARHIVMSLWADFHPFQAAAEACGRRCHNSAMYARERVLNRAGYDQDFAALVARIAENSKEKPIDP